MCNVNKYCSKRVQYLLKCDQRHEFVLNKVQKIKPHSRIGEKKGKKASIRKNKKQESGKYTPHPEDLLKSRGMLSISCVIFDSKG